MVNHVALFYFKKNMSESDKRIEALKFKRGIESLIGKVDGLISISVESMLISESTSTCVMIPESSTADVLLLCKLTDEAALDRLKNTPLLFNIKSVFDLSLESVHMASYFS